MTIRTAALALVLLSAATLAIATPKVTKKVPPEYPAEAVRKNISSGSVRAKLTIAATARWPTLKWSRPSPSACSTVPRWKP